MLELSTTSPSSRRRQKRDSNSNNSFDGNSNDDDGNDDHHAEAEEIERGTTTTEIDIGHEEATGLISDLQSFYTDEYYDDDDYDDDGRSGNRLMIIVMGIVLIIAFLAVIIPETGTLWFLKSPARIPVEYTCPSTTTTSSSSIYQSMYQNTTNLIETNSTEFLKSYKDTNYDLWGVSYDSFKSNMNDFVIEFFPKYLTDGDTIYASSCGNGLGIIMTLEILSSISSSSSQSSSSSSSGKTTTTTTTIIENLIVYGSDHKQESIAMFNAIMDSTLFQTTTTLHAEKGVICYIDDNENNNNNNDSMTNNNNNENTVVTTVVPPSESFDLVYTGHISPLKDPLQFGKNLTILAEYYTSICRKGGEEGGDWRDEKLRQQAQEKQEVWYGMKVAELARIAKPGRPVIIEQVSEEYCNAQFDWGGVSKDWWTKSAKDDTYNWDIDYTSIAIRDDSLFKERYHVFMLKNG